MLHVLLYIHYMLICILYVFKYITLFLYYVILLSVYKILFLFLHFLILNLCDNVYIFILYTKLL